MLNKVVQQQHRHGANGKETTMSVHANGVQREAGAETETFELAFRAIELDLTHDDPTFTRRVRRQAGVERTNVAIVFALLVATVLLLAAGLATYSWSVFVAGAVAFISAFAVDDRYRRRRARLSLQD
jgi:Flp pilus assembly protein TadB